jgi:two-component system, OmpR family, response regulator ChvI
LLVDNEPDVLLSLKIVLQDNGFQVDSFIDPLLALENFRANVYDLLILDIKMPGINGFELYKKIRKIDDKVRVCFMTAGEMNYYQFRKEVFPALDNNAIFKSQLKIKY